MITTTTTAADDFKEVIKTVTESTLKLWKDNASRKEELPTPQIVFDLKGKVAGQYNHKTKQIRVNLSIAMANSKEYLENTLPHEIAHYIVKNSVKFTHKHKPHGRAWKYVMNVLGCEPTVTHSYACSPSRKHTYYEYQCTRCFNTSQFTKIVLMRMVKGSQYTCKCGELINYKNMLK